MRPKSWVLTAAVLGSTLAFVDRSVVNVALPRIESELSASLAAMQWVINAYTLSMTALLLLGGAAADQFGRRRVFVIGVATFTAASLLCGCAPNAAVLIVARTLQGVGAALLVPCSLALIGAAYGEHERGAAIGIWSGASALAAGAAPLLGGVLLDQASWRAIFLINPLLALPTLWITLRRVPESRDPDAAPGVDWPGALLAFAGLGSLVYGLIAAATLGWGSAAVLTALAAGALLLMAFVVAERGRHGAMMPLELFRSRTFSGINLLTLLLYGALGGAFFFLPFLLIQARGFSATAAGGVFLPFTIVLGVLSRWSGGLLDRCGARGPLIAGPALSGVGFVLLAAAVSYRATLAAMTCLGFGMVITVAPLTTAVINAVPPHRTGVASGINNAVASLGGLLVIAILGGVVLSTFERTLDARLAQQGAAPAVHAAVDPARGGLVMPALPAGLAEGQRRQARAIVADALVQAVRTALWVAAGLALASALVAAVSVPARPAHPGAPLRSAD
jgi:EmrB/QacA subfamily drug resistance transporter